MMVVFTNMGENWRRTVFQGEGRKQEINCGYIEPLMPLNTHRLCLFDI
jgi:hypothetical protein